MQNTQWTVPPSASQAPDIRIVQLDVLRGLAVLGIYWINVVVFGLPSGAYAYPDLVGHADQANIAVWAFSEVFVEGAMRGLFSLLFGASAMVFLNESRLAGGGLEVVDRYYRRTTLLILFGLLHAYLLLWPYDVLYAYGLLGLFLFPLRNFNPRILLILGCILLLSGEAELYTRLYSFDSDYAGDLKGSPVTLRETMDALKTEPVENEHEVMRETMEFRKDTDSELYASGYIHILTNNLKDVAEQQSTMMYTTHFFDIGGMMLIGMALLKLGILSGQRSTRFYLFLMFFGFLIGASGRGYNVYTDIVHKFSPTELLNYTHVSYNFSRVPITLGYIGMIGLICRSNLFDWLSNMLAKVGRLALTNYIMQTLFSIFIFYGFGLGLFSLLERYQLIYVCVTVWGIQIGFSIVWLKYFKYGPLEWLWRSLIYGKRQPMLKL